MVKLRSPLYDRLKFLAQVLLPALAAAYFSLAGIWGLPAAEEVVGTIVVIDTFLGVLLQLSSTAYSQNADGSIKIEEKASGEKVYSMELNEHPENIDHKKEVRFKVVKPKK